MSIPPLPERLFICDPELNTVCTKRACYLNGGPCKYTHKIEFARKPIEKVMLRIPMSAEEAKDLQMEELPDEQ